MIGSTLPFLVPTLRWVGILLTGRLRRHRKPQRVYWSSVTTHLPYLVGVWPLERISHLSRRRRIMETKKRICLLLAALLSLSGVQPAAATDYQASDYLPLAVGNSWTYEHFYFDTEEPYYPGVGYYPQWPTYRAQWPEEPQFTITVERTEVIDGKTYYVISDMPAGWPPAPPHFIAGKKLRWEGTHLMERTADGEQAIYRFDGANETGYEIPTDEGSNRVTVRFQSESVPSHWFSFHGNFTGGRGFRFLAGYGLSGGRSVIFPHFENDISPLHAVLGGRRVQYEDALTPTNTSSSSWGQIKQSLLVNSMEERADR